MYTYTCTYIYIYIYVSLYVHMYIYLYISRNIGGQSLRTPTGAISRDQGVLF